MTLHFYKPYGNGTFKCNNKVLGTNGQRSRSLFFGTLNLNMLVPNFSIFSTISRRPICYSYEPPERTYIKIMIHQNITLYARYCDLVVHSNDHPFRCVQ